MLLKNTAWLTLSQVVRMILGLLVGTWLTRAIGPEENGWLGTAVVIGSLAGFVADFGLRLVLIREMSTRPAAVPTLFGTAVRLLTLLGLGGFILALVVAYFWGGIKMLMLGCILYGPLVFNAYLAVLSRWDAEQQSHRGAKLALLCNVLGNALRILCIVSGAHLGFAAATIAIEGFIAGTVSFLIARRHGWLPQLRLYDAATARSLMREALPLFLAHSGTLLLMRVDQLMVFRMSGDAEAGIYAAAARFSEIIYAVGPVIIQSLMARLAVSHSSDPAMYVRHRAAIFSVLSLAGFASALGWLLTGHFVVDLIYGPAFARAGDVLMIHCISALPFMHGDFRNSLLVIERRSVVNAHAALTGIIINVTLNLWLIPTHGAIGAAWATAITYFIVWFAASLIIPSLRPIGWDQLRSLTLLPAWHEYLRHRENRIPAK